jgi:hypothetical protein
MNMDNNTGDKVWEKDNETVVRIQPQRRRGGEWVQIGLDEYRIPPLGLGDIQELAPEIEKLKGITQLPDKDQMDAVFKIVHCALLRNYPDHPMSETRAMVDLGNFQEILGKVMGIAGFMKVSGVPSGEVKASTGTQSTSP